MGGTALSVTAYPAAVREVAYDAADLALTNPDNILADDGTFATVTNSGANQGTKTIIVEMGANAFSILSCARIDTVTLEYQVKTNSGTDQWVTEQAQIVIGGSPTGRNMWNTALGAGSAEATHSIAGPWGVPLTADIVNAADFGFALRMFRSGAAAITLSIDFIRIKIDYTTCANLDQHPPAGFALSTLPKDADAVTTMRLALGMEPALGLFFQPLIMKTNWGNNGQTSPIKRSTNNARIHIGMAAGGDAYSTFSNVRDNAAPHSPRYLYDDGTIASGDSGGSLLSTFGGIGAGYIDVDWVTLSTRVALFAAGIAAEQAHIHSQGGVDPAATPTATVNCGFAPDLVIMMSGLEITPSSPHGQYAGWEIGFALHDGAGGFIKRSACVEFISKRLTVALAEFENRVFVSESNIHNHHDPGASPATEPFDYAWDISGRTGTGYTLDFSGDDSADDGGDDGAWFAALKLNDGDQAAVSTFTTPTSTGAADFTTNFSPAIPFKPKFMMMVMTMAEGVGAWEGSTTIGDIPAGTEANGDVLAVAFMDQQRCVSGGMTNEAGLAVSRTSNWIDASRLLLLKGDETDAFAATFGGFVDGGFDANFTTVDATARKWICLAIG